MQYEEQITALQQQVSTMQNHQAEGSTLPDLQTQLQEAVAALRQQLGEDHGQMLDQLLADLNSQFQEQITQLKAQHTEEVALQVQAMKIAAEQVHQSHLRLVQAELEARHQQELAESQARLLPPAGLQEFARLCENWEQQYAELTQRLGRDLDTRLTQVLQALPSESNEESGAESRTLPQPACVQEIQQLLSNQQEEMTALRSCCLAEFEEALRHRSHGVEEQAAEVVALQAEIDALQQQYQQLLQEKRVASSGESCEQVEEDQEDLQKAMAELKSYYEKRVETIEQTFEKEIAELKAKYEMDMAAVHDEGTDVDHVQLGSSPVREIPERDSTGHSPLVSAVLAGHGPDGKESQDTAHVQELQRAVEEKEQQILQLQSQLQEEKTKLRSLEAASKEDKESLNAMQAQLEEAVPSGPSAQPSTDLLAEKEAECEQYLHKLSEKDQHISELVEMESVLRKENGQLKEQLVDSEAQLKVLSDSNKSNQDDSDKVKELEELVAGKKEECEKFVKDLEGKEKELNMLHVELQSYLELEQQWKQKEADWTTEKDQLSAELLELSDKQKALQARLEDADHRHQEQLEAVRQELEHERQVEVETLQSEFKVQLEIELKRQAVQLANTKSAIKLDLLEEADMVGSSSLGRGSPGSREGDSLDGSSVDVGPAAVAAAARDAAGQDGEAKEGSRVERESLQGTQQQQANVVGEKDGELHSDLLTWYQAQIMELEKQLKDLQNRHARLLSGEGPEIEQLLKDRYDNELELAKSFQQSEFDEMMKAEKKKFVERHRGLMDGFMKEKQEEMEQLKAEHEKVLEETRASIIQEYEEKLKELSAQQETEPPAAMPSGEDLGLVQQQLQTEIQSLQQMLAEKEQAMETKEEEIAVKLMQLESLHNQKLHQMAEDYEKLEAAHRKELAAVQEELRRQLEAAHQEELGQQQQHLEGKHHKELANLQQQQQQLLDRLQQEHREALEKLQQQHQEELQKAVEAQRREERDQGSTLCEITEISMPVATVQQQTAPAVPEEEQLPVWSTPRPSSSGEAVTRSFAQVVSGIPSIPQAHPPLGAQGTQPPPTSPLPPLGSTSEEEKDRIIHKLREEVAALSGQLEQQQQQQQQPQQPREASSGRGELAGGDNLLSMLRANLETTGTEREAVQHANDRLLQLLSDAVKTYLAVEDSINRRLARIVTQGSRTTATTAPHSGSSSSGDPSSHHHPREGPETQDAERLTPTPHSEGAEGGGSQDTTLEETSFLSVATDEGLDVSQRLVEGLFLGPDLDAEGEELVQDARDRLQRVVIQLLDGMERSTQQLMEARSYQEDLLASLETAHQDLQAERARAEEAEDRLRDEVSAKEYFAQELHKAEGLISGYSAEREELESRLQRLEEEREVMAGDLERTHSRLADFEADQQSLEAQRQALQRQQTLLQRNTGAENQGSELGDVDMTSGGQALLGELSKMTEDKRQLQQQLKHQAQRNQASLRELESLSEEQQQRMENELEAQRAEIADLKLQLDNTERQLRAKKQFIDEQSAEREQEREEYQREIDRMKEVVANLDRRGSAQGRLQQEVADLTEQLESRISSHSEMVQRTEQMQRDLQDKELTAGELKQMVGQLERELEEKGTREAQLQQRIHRLEEQVRGHVPQSETSEPGTSPPAREQRGSPRMLSPERQGLPGNLLSLQEELLRAHQQEEELQQEKELLQQQVQEQMLQISALRNQLDDLKHWGTDPVTSSSHLADLRQQLQSLRDQLEKREQEVGVLEEDKEKLEEKLSQQEAETDILREAVKSGNYTEAGQVDSLTQERDRLQHEVVTLQEQLAERESQAMESPSQQSSLSGDYSLTDRDPPGLLSSSLTQRTNFHQELQQTVAERESALAAAETELESSRQQVAELQAQLAKLQSQHSKLQEEGDRRLELMSEKETAVEQLQEQVESLQQEISSLTTFQNELQKDFDEVQTMLEEKEREMEALTRELADSRLSAEAPDPELVLKLEREILALKKELQEKVNVINEKEEEMYVINEKLEQQDAALEQLRTTQEERDLAQARLREAAAQLAQMKEQEQQQASRSRESEEEQDGTLQMELYATQEEKRLLEEELEEKEKLLGLKEAKLEELRNRVKGEEEAKEEPVEEAEETEVRVELLEKRLEEREREIGTLKSQLESLMSTASSGRIQDDASLQEVEALRSCLREAQDTIGRLQASGRVEWARSEEREGLEAADVPSLQQQLHQCQEELELFRTTASLSAADFVKKVMELRRELSAAHQEQIRDVQTRFADEEEARLSMLQQRHQLELDQQQKVWERRLTAAVNQERQTLEQQHSAHLAELRQLHQREIDTLLQSRTAWAEDEGTAVTARLQAKVRDTEGWLDSRLLRHLGQQQQQQQQEGEATGGDSVDAASLSDLSSSLDVTSEETISSRLQALLERLHRQGLNLLTLSELQFLKHHLSPEQQQAAPGLGDSPALLAATAAWQRERQTLVSTIAALKELLSQVHRAAAPSMKGDKDKADAEGDWRGELLTALCNVFGTEREKLLAELRTFLSSQSADSQSALETLEKRVRDQEDTHRQALQQLLSADRQSLLEEIRALRSGHSVGQQHQQQELLQLQEKLAEVEKKEWQLQRKVQVLEYKLQQKEVIEEDLKASLAAEQERLGEEREQLAKEREHSLQLQTELNSLQLHTSQLEDALERDRLRFATFSDELEEMRGERARLLELLEQQQQQQQQPAAAAVEGKSVPESSSALRHSQHEANAHFIKELSAELEHERAHSSDLAHQLELQSSRYTSLEQELEAQMRQAEMASTDLTNQITQLQQSLDTESGRTSELARALERERQLRRSREQAEPEPSQEPSLAAAAADLRSRLAAEQARVSHLQTALEREQRQRASTRQLQEEEERAPARQAQEEERLASRQLATQLETLQGAEEGEEDVELQQHLALSRRHLESILQRLEHVTVQLQQLPQSQREHAVLDSSSSQLQQQLDNILAEVRQLQRLVTGQEVSRGAEAVLVSFINEHVLQHNAELNSYIAVLCREKEELRNSNTLLQQEVEAARSTQQRAQQRPQQVESEGSSGEAEEEWLRQRALWASEKLTLQMALDSAEREVEHLQVELRRIRQQLDSEGLFTNPKRDKMNKLYGKYLRAESYRRALVYQKRYLLQLLGGYEDCERETLDIIAAMGAHPTVREVQLRQQFSRPLNRFRAAAYTSIAVYRLRYLVKKWRRATRVGSPVITGCLDVNTGYIPTAGSFSPPTSPPRTARSQPPGPPPRPALTALTALTAYHPSAQPHSSQLQSRQLHSQSTPSHCGVSSSSGAYGLLPLGQEDPTQETLVGSRSFQSLASSSSGGAPFPPQQQQQARAAGHYQPSSASRALGGGSRGEGGRQEASYSLDQARVRTYSSASAAVASGQHRLARQQANGSSTGSFSSGGLRFNTHERSSPRDLRSPARRRNLQDFDGNARVSSRSRESQNDEFIQRLENLQHRLSGYSPRDHSRPKQRHTLSLQ